MKVLGRVDGVRSLYELVVRNTFASGDVEVSLTTAALLCCRQRKSVEPFAGATATLDVVDIAEVRELFRELERAIGNATSDVLECVPIPCSALSVAPGAACLAAQRRAYGGHHDGPPDLSTKFKAPPRKAVGVPRGLRHGPGR